MVMVMEIKYANVKHLFNLKLADMSEFLKGEGCLI